MNSSNTFSEFVLNCQHDNDQKVITSVVLAIAYLITVFGNGGVVLVILSDYRLQRPMYLYIIVLAMLDMIFCNIAIPRIIAILLSEARAVPSKVCAFQMYIFHYAETLESFILTLMAFDRKETTNIKFNYYQQYDHDIHHHPTSAKPSNLQSQE
ncbi:OR1I1 protein, partial [Polypterus senegalus]